MLLLRLLYIANILVAGWISISALFFPSYATRTVFAGTTYAPSDLMRLVGCLWLAIAILSIWGLVNPIAMVPVLLVQLIYKSSWLCFVGLPTARAHVPYPEWMAVFFIVWVLVLPFVIPWRMLF